MSHVLRQKLGRLEKKALQRKRRGQEKRKSNENKWSGGFSKKNRNDRKWNDTRKDKGNGKGPNKQLDKK